jgi:hypothetical protein
MNLEQRVAYLEDFEAIRRLKGLYCLAVDGGWDAAAHRGDEFAQLFTDDATLEFRLDPSLGEPAVAKGREAIRRMINAASFTPYASHNMCGEMIQVDGDRATAKWHAMNFVSGDAGGTVLTVHIYDESYVRTSRGWRIASVVATCRGIHPQVDGTRVSPGKRRIPAA